MHPPNDESCSIDRLVPYANNARTHSRKQVMQIADSIRRFGFTNPVLVADDGTIIAGHGRVEAAKLIADAIKDCSNRGDIVLDVFGGSGSTLFATD